ncbi:MAG: TRAP transporter substrate-binding protein [Deltaproteobacteria bacterium]|nr:TRAP transporter substrate-binding protein [Deltaproteobacteria bacterium]
MKSGKWFLVLLLGMVLVGLPLMNGNAKAADFNLTYSNFFPPTHFNGKLGDEWAKEIEKRTDGKVKITYFPGGSLLKGPAIYDGVLKGVTDIGMSCFAYTPGRFPALESLDLPMGYPTGYAASMTANDFLAKFKPAELDKVEILYIHAHGPGLLHMKMPINNLEELKGKKIRATGLSAKVVGALGGAAVGMPQGGTYEALQKGVVEGTFGPIEVLKGWKQGEVIKYTTDCFSVGYTTAMYIAMNKKKWDSMPADVQKVFEEVSREWVAKHAEGWDTADAEGREFSASLGNQFITLSDQESTRWAEAVSPVIEEYIKAKEAMGLPAKEYVEFIKASIKKYSKK